MSSDRMKTAHYGPVSKRYPCALTQKLMNGRYLRWSWRTNSWQFQDSITMQWRNINVHLARALTSAGFIVREDMTDVEEQQLELFGDDV